MRVFTGRLILAIQLLVSATSDISQSSQLSQLGIRVYLGNVNSRSIIDVNGPNSDRKKELPMKNLILGNMKYPGSTH
ncbi:hypothetical protein F5Y02DRAFT_195190 [Annulohypoxylon stygium]|nr:hypothetical protein F5Y02DRAFT_195190 [Annulohypoxylon stygium]